MTKKRSKALFILFAIILVICLVATFFSFTYPLAINGNYYRYSSFLENVNLGQDISSCLKIVYRADLPENEQKSSYEALRNSTINELKAILQDEGYKDTTASTYSDNSIVLNVGNLLTREAVDSVLSLVGNPATIHFSMSDQVSEAFAHAKDVRSVQAYDYSASQEIGTTYYVLIRFKDANKIAEATKNGGSVHIFFGENEFTSVNLNNEGITDGYILFTSDSFETHEIANSYANRIKTGMLDLELTQIEQNVVEGSYGSFTRTGNRLHFANLSAILMWIALGVLVLAGFVFLIVKYRQIGWVACFNLLFFICIGLFLVQSIPILHINFAGMIGLILCFVLAIDSLMEILERTKKYYNADAKLYIAFKTAQKESLLKIFLSNGLLILSGLICVLMPSATIQSFGWATLVLPFVTLFISLVMFRLFIKMYLAFNNSDGKKCNFHKGGKNA